MPEDFLLFQRRAGRQDIFQNQGSGAARVPSPEPVRPATRGHMATSEPLEEKGEPVFEMGDARALNVISKASFGTSTSDGMHCDW